MASIPINDISVYTADRVLGGEYLPIVENDGGNYYTYRTAISSLFYNNSISNNALSGGITPGKLSTGAPQWTITDFTTTSLNNYLGYGQSSDVNLFLAPNRTGPNNTSLLFASDTVSNSNASIARQSTTNGDFIISNNGTGTIGIKNLSAGNVTISTDNIERLRVTSTGLVGIGTSSPTSTLHVAGNTTITGNLSSLSVFVAGSGIETGYNSLDSQPSYISLGKRRMGQGDSSLFLYSSSAGNYSFFTKQSGSNGDTILGDTGTGDFYLRKANSTGSIVLQTGSSAGTTRAVIASNGNIGINTTSPSTTLDVNGALRTSSLSAISTVNLGSDINTGSGVTQTRSTNLYIGSNRSGVGDASVFFYSSPLGNNYGFVTKLSGSNGDTIFGDIGTGDLVLRKQSNSGKIQFETGSTPTVKMSLSGNGYLGIGTAAPLYNLHVVGTARANSFVSASSLRYKTNVKPLNKALDLVESLQGVSFDWKETGKSDIGLIAEEVNKVLPMCVSKNIDNEPDAIDYSKLTSILIEAIKELKSQIK